MVGQIKISFVAISNTGRLYTNKRFWELDCKDNGSDFKALQSITRLFKLFSLTSLIYWPCLGLRLHSGILNVKCRKIQKNVIYSTDSCESFKFIHFTGWATKSDGFFPIHATFCPLYSWLILSVQKMIYFDLLYLSFPGSLGYIVFQHYESLFVLPISSIPFNMGPKWFCLSCIRRDLVSSASCVKR